jgi:hypothetical protein
MRTYGISSDSEVQRNARPGRKVKIGSHQGWRDRYDNERLKHQGAQGSVLMFVLMLALGISMVVFGLPFRGACWLFIVSGMFASLAGIGIGVTLATVSKSQQQAQLLTFFVNPPLTLMRICPISFRLSRISTPCVTL